MLPGCFDTQIGTEALAMIASEEIEGGGRRLRETQGHSRFFVELAVADEGQHLRETVRDPFLFGYRNRDGGGWELSAKRSTWIQVCSRFECLEGSTGASRVGL